MNLWISIPWRRGHHRDLIHGNARHARPGTTIEVGARVTVGDDDWEVAEAEIVRHDPETGALLLRVTSDLRPEAPHAVPTRGA